MSGNVHRYPASSCRSLSFCLSSRRDLLLSLPSAVACSFVCHPVGVCSIVVRREWRHPCISRWPSRSPIAHFLCAEKANLFTTPLRSPVLRRLVRLCRHGNPRLSAVPKVTSSGRAGLQPCQKSVGRRPYRSAEGSHSLPLSLLFSAQITHVKALSHLTYDNTTTSTCPMSFPQPAILDIELKKRKPRPTRRG
jgi:hypothetical protein